MTPQALTDLKARCQTAKQYGRAIANAAAHAGELERIAGPVKLAPGVAKHSAAHLLALIEKVERVQAGQEDKATVPPPAPTPVAAPAPEPTPAAPAAKPEKGKKKGKSKKAAKADAEDPTPTDAEGSEDEEGDDA
jgi:hypothetical protein